MHDLEHLEQELVTASHIVHQQGLVNAFGHVSARIPGTETFLFPPRRSPALIRVDNLLVLDVEGNQLAGEGRPNTEFWIHARIYKARPDVQAVCHVHSPNCVAVGSVGETIRPLHHPASAFKDGVPVFDRIGLIRTRELGDAVAKTLGACRAMLLRGHGANVAGEDIRRACVLALWLEEAAGLQLRAMAAGQPRYFDPEEMERVHDQLFAEPGPVNRAWEYFSSLVAEC
ncbi:MAG: class II aldolase/adducin family protein [Chloroflexi bacterium]|nr:class II aldolase/adducin family protein [Chloroflexota bacterium]